MNKLTFILPAAAVLGLAGTAIAAPGQTRMPQGDMTRAQAEQRAETRFARMDANSDGKLDQADRAAMRDKMFARIDTDGNGQISRTEFDAMAGKQRKGQRGNRMAANGEVTKAAFVDRAMTMFERADANKDGTVTPAERKAARETMRKAWQERRAANRQG